MQPHETPRSLAKLVELPDLVTLAGLSCAFLAMAAAIQRQLELAAALLLVAVLGDIFDGKVARAIGRRNREFGAAFDTVCDAVAFGAAPALFGLCAGLDHAFGMVLLSTYLAAAVLRLARFQSSPWNANHFTGMPVPYGNVAIALAYLLLTGFGGQAYVAAALMLLYPALALLMVSTLRWPKL